MTDPTFYGSAVSVVTRTGIKCDDLGLDSEDELETFIEEVLAEVSDLFDRTMRQTYLGADAVETPVPAGLNGIANDACADELRYMVSTRQTPVVRIDDFAVRPMQTRILTPDIQKRLKVYGKGGGLVSVDMQQDAINDLPLGITLAVPNMDTVDLETNT